MILLASTATVFVAMSASTGTSQGLQAQRPLVDEGKSLVLGEVGQGQLVSTVANGGITSAVETGTLKFSGRGTLDELMRGASLSQSPGPRP